MGLEIKKLVLFEPLRYSTNNADSEEKMTKFTTNVTAKTMNPLPQDYLTQPVFCGANTNSRTDYTAEIPAGTYAFVQWSQKEKLRLESVAETLWLECLWQEFQPKDNTLYLRELPHGDFSMFQLFREILPD